MSQLQNITNYLRPGIRGKLSIFIGVMLFAMVSVTLAIVLKQQFVSLSALSVKEFESYLTPVDSMTQEIDHHTKNLITLEKIKYLAIKNETSRSSKKRPPYDFGAYFKPKNIEKADDRLRSQIKASKTDDALEKKEFQSLQKLANWLSLYDRKNNKSKQIRLNLERQLRNAINYDVRASTALSGLDLTKNRIESIDPGRWIRFDSRQMISSIARRAPINQLKWNKKGETDAFHKELDLVYDAWADQKNPKYNTSALEYADKNAKYLLLTRTLFRNPDVTDRAIKISKILSSASIWKKYVFEEKSINKELKQISFDIKTRRLQLREEEKRPRFDKDLNKLIKEYKTLLKKRKDLLKGYFFILLEQYQPELYKVEKDLLVIQQELRKKEIRSDKEKYRELLKQRNELISKRNDSGYTAIHQQVDAFESLRSAALYHKIVMTYDFDQRSYYDYIHSRLIRNYQKFKWKGIRAWIFSYRSEIYINNNTIRGGLLTKTRSQAEEIMWEIDSLPLDDLARQLLYENTIGFNRILMDQTSSIKEIHAQRDTLLDTTLSISFRILFIAFLLSWYFVRTIQSIIAGAGRVGRGDLSVRFTYDGQDELGTLVSSLNHMVKDLKEREELRSELSAAEEIQKRLLPMDMPSNMSGHLEFGSFYKAMSGVGGDYYDYIKAGPNKFVFCIADVSNHGVGPAIIMTLLRSQLHGIIARGVTEPKQILSELNDRIYQDTPSNIFITMFLGTYDKKSHEIICCSAGHNLAYMFRTRGNKLSKLQITGMPLGAVDSGLFDGALETGKTVLNKGDLFYQYTDGVNEAMNNDLEQYGMDRLANIIEKNVMKNPQDLVTMVAKDVEVFAGKNIFCDGPSELNDDIAMIAFRRIK